MNRTHPRAISLALALGAAALLAGCPSSSKEACTSPSLRCGDRCVAAGSDPSNCGACGNVCAAGTSCCNARCVDVRADDPANCGACGHRCPTGATCAAGACACPSSTATTCGPSPGACVDRSTDPSDCGACGRACAGPGVVAADATCATGACACAGAATDCSATGATPPCVDRQTDAANCGSCGHACANRSTCSSGTCACGAAAYPDNCGSTQDPVCVSKSTDPANCGACGYSCTGSTPSCQAGRCCAAGQSNCSGTCVDTRTSATHCGACGHRCASGQVCSNGACGCGGPTSLACGTSCCAGTACCAANTCQTQHSNGLGGSFYDCTTTYTLATLTRSVALAAADSWQKGTATYDLFCSGNCVARQTTSACAMWCWQGTYAGRAVQGGVVCDALCNELLGGSPGSSWP